MVKKLLLGLMAMMLVWLFPAGWAWTGELQFQDAAGNKWITYVNENGGIMTVFQDQLLIGTNGAGLVVRDKETLLKEHTYTTRNSRLPGNIIRSFNEHGGKLFIVTDRGPCWYDGEKIKPAGEGPAISYLIKASLDGGKSFNGSTYLKRYSDGGEFIIKVGPSLGVSEINPGFPIKDFTFGSGGELIVLADDGIYREKNNGEFARVMVLPGEDEVAGQGYSLRYTSIFYDSARGVYWYSYQKYKLDGGLGEAIFSPSYLVRYRDGMKTEYELGTAVRPREAFFLGAKAVFACEKRLSLDSTGGTIALVKGNKIKFPNSDRLDFIGRVEEGWWYYHPVDHKLVLVDDELEPLKEINSRPYLYTTDGWELWLGTGGELRRVGDGEQVLPWNYLPFENTHSIQRVEGKTVYLSCRLEEDMVFDFKKARLVFTGAGGETAEHRYLTGEPALVDSRGNKWFKSARVGYWYCITPGGKEISYSRANMKGTPFYEFMDIGEDNEGNIWFLSSEGLTKMTPGGEFTYFIGRDILKDQLLAAGKKGYPVLFRDIKIDGQGKLWVYSNTLGLVNLNGDGTVNKVCTVEGHLEAFFLGQKGYKWLITSGPGGLLCTVLDNTGREVDAGTAGEVITRFENAKYYHDPASGAHFLALSTFEPGRERFGILRVVDVESCQVYRNQLDFKDYNIMFTGICRRHGYIWFITPAGMVRYDGREFITTQYAGEGWIKSPHCHIAGDSVWMLTTTGLARVHL